MKLGIVYKDNKIINHRSFIKVIFNPILRYFGYQLGTLFINGELKNTKIGKCDKQKIKWEKYTTDYDYILKKRTLI